MSFPVRELESLLCCSREPHTVTVYILTYISHLIIIKIWLFKTYKLPDYFLITIWNTLELIVTLDWLR